MHLTSGVEAEPGLLRRSPRRCPPVEPGSLHQPEEAGPGLGRDEGRYFIKDIRSGAI